jgi:hypothetical protein
VATGSDRSAPPFEERERVIAYLDREAVILSDPRVWKPGISFEG